MAIRQPHEMERRTTTLSLDAVQQNDHLIAADGVELGTLQGLYDGGPWQGQLLVQSAGDEVGRQEVYTVPAWTLERRDAQTHSVYASVSAAHARANWLIDVIG